MTTKERIKRVERMSRRIERLLAEAGELALRAKHETEEAGHEATGFLDLYGAILTAERIVKEA